MSNNTPDEFYGRRKGRPLRPKQAALLRSQIEQWGITPPAGPLNLAALFTPVPAALWLEIGFGNGEHMLWQAATNPHVGIIGCEPFVNGLAQCCVRIAESGLSNIRLYDGDARRIVTALVPHSLDRIFILFPDPWPKRRHHKRRLVARTVLGHLARALKPGGDIRLATDDPDYAEWMLFEASMTEGLSWQARGAQDWREKPADWPLTRYESKARKAGRDVYFLTLGKTPHQSNIRVHGHIKTNARNSLSE